MRKTLLSLAVAGAMAVGASAASAATQSYSFSSCLSGCSGSVASIATLTLNDIVGGVSFSLTSTAPPGSFIGKFLMDGPNGTFASTGVQTISSGTWVAVPASNSNTSLNGYQWTVDFPPPPGNGDHFLPGDNAAWTILGAGVSVASFTNPARMMIHLQNIPPGYGMDDSAKLAPAVPEPETYAMFLAGLGLMGVLARRKQARREEDALAV
ncbi:hypothetical protein OTERR_29150 [Oryzomicrobium terrae]|uniref:Ice-binding protein C-terminal domain-containing protein n=1 Tax=Oryzomicrobium terrae TaxID=1735038 RepID=A0A5C1EBL3_9RHOO|nr:PEP-CTERM sorting domain-containing protein [Oryzomicrobium terrae]QEL66391.1 hypothetical protein OTERR_29150 [Oryzomicrobium terrae]